MLTNTHINCTMSALFLLSLQASQCLLLSCCSCLTPPTCSEHSSEEHLPPLILLSHHSTSFSFLFFFFYTYSLSAPLFFVFIVSPSSWAYPMFPALTEEQISLSVLSCASLSSHETIGMEKTISDTLAWS